MADNFFLNFPTFVSPSKYTLHFCKKKESTPSSVVVPLTKLDLGNLGVHVVNKGLHPGGIFLFVFVMEGSRKGVSAYVALAE